MDMSLCWKYCLGQTTEDTERVRVIDHSCQGLHDVPGHLFLHERTLEELILNSNRIEDLPLPLFHCHALTVLNLSQNMLSVIPVAIGSLTSLKNLDLSRNCIEVIPEDLKKCRKLVVLNLSVNPLTHFPDAVTKLISLEELYLSDIQLDYLPANTCRLVHLRILELRENRLSNLPKAIARLSHLTRLDIGLNDFWDIPEVVGSLYSLEELWVDLNYVREIPPFIGNLHRLTHFESGDNSLISVHDYLTRCIHLVDLTLTGCKIEVFPENLSALTELVTLRLDRNKLVELPATIGRLNHLQELNLGYNYLTELPGSVGLLRKLTFLCIDKNCMEHLPKEIGSCVRLSVLSVQGNRLTEIPAEVGSLNSLTVLDLRSNRLRNLPMSLLKLDNLTALWLSHNQSKPITPLVKELEIRTNSNVLTCYLLPQEDSCHYQVSLMKKKSDDDVVGPSAACRITFAAGSSDRPNLLIRAPTPYPKRLRELAKTARSICHLHQNEDREEQVKPQGRQPKCDEIRTAIVKKNEVAPVLERQCESTASDIQLPQKPPPYHIAAAYSKHAMMFAVPSFNDGESDITDEKLPVYTEEVAGEVKNVPFKIDRFLQQIPLYANNKTAKQDRNESNNVDIMLMESDELSYSDLGVKCKLNGKHEGQENQYNYSEPVGTLQENGNSSDLDICQNYVSKSLHSVSNGSVSSNQTTASVVNNDKAENTYLVSSKCNPYENITFEYSDIKNSRFQIRKVKDTLPRMTREKSVLKVKRRCPSKLKDDYLNFEWDFGSTDQLNADAITENGSVKNSNTSMVQEHESEKMCESEGKNASLLVPGSSHDSPANATSLSFDVNGNSCDDSSSKNTVENAGPEGSNTENVHRKSSSKRHSKRNKTPWIFGQHKNPVVMQVEVPKLTIFNMGFTLERKKFGLYISRVENIEPVCKIFQVGDKILEIEGVNMSSVITVDMVYDLMLSLNRSFTVLISRQT